MRTIAIFDFVYTLASTNINQSALNLVKRYITIRSFMSSIMSLIILEQLEYLSLNQKNCCHDFVYTMSSTIFNQSTPDLVKMYMTARSQMSSIMGLVRPEQFALESEKNAIFDFVYSLASTLFIKSASNLVKILMTIRSRMSLIISLIGP